jgi:hypothetical protein
MAEGRQRATWAQTSAVLALVANCHRDPKKHRAFTPADFNPYGAAEDKEPIPKTRDLKVLKSIFVDSRQGGRTHG